MFEEIKRQVDPLEDFLKEIFRVSSWAEISCYIAQTFHLTQNYDFSYKALEGA